MCQEVTALISPFIKMTLEASMLIDYTLTKTQNGNLSVNLLKMWTLLQQLTTKKASEETVLCASVALSCFVVKKVY